MRHIGPDLWQCNLSYNWVLRLNLHFLDTPWLFLYITIYCSYWLRIICDVLLQYAIITHTGCQHISVLNYYTQTAG